MEFQSRRLLLAALVPLLAGALFSGCALFNRPPQGFQRASAGEVSFVYPETWREVTQEGDNSGVPFAAELRRDGRVVAQVGVLDDVTDKPDVVLAAHTAIATMQVSRADFHVKGLDVVEVDGADDARRLNYTYSINEKGGNVTPARGIDVAALGPNQTPVVVRVNWLTGRVTAGTVEQIVTSVSVG